MALNVYRRHGPLCQAEEPRRSWKKCSCPIYASGTLNGYAGMMGLKHEQEAAPAAGGSE